MCLSPLGSLQEGEAMLALRNQKHTSLLRHSWQAW